jgi:hypothetical protein
VAGANRRWILRLPRRADQQHGIIRVSLPRSCPVAPAALPAEPEGIRGLGADGEAGRRISPKAPCPASLAKCAVRRQTPKVGAECGNSARSDLCGGRSVMTVPTANLTVLLDRFAHRVIPRNVDNRCACKTRPRGSSRIATGGSPADRPNDRLRNYARVDSRPYHP